jgi:hypothetical protein
MPTLIATFEGIHHATWTMDVTEEHWNSYLKENPDYNEYDIEDIEKAWYHFKDDLNYYDEPSDSVDLNNDLFELVVK